MFAASYFPKVYFAGVYFPPPVNVPPPVVDTTGFNAVDPRRLPILFDSHTLSMIYDREGLPILENTTRFPIRFVAKGLPIFYTEKKIT